LVSNPAFFYLQVDLFFYRDPEEAKELEEEAMVAPEYGVVTEYTALAGDTWGVEWGAGEASPAPAQTGTEWTAASGISSFTLIIKILIAWQREFYFGCVIPVLVCLACFILCT
jgi:hypothetical protein